MLKIDNFSLIEENPISKDGSYSLSLKNIANPLSFNVKKGSNVDIYLVDIPQSNELTFFVQENSHCSVKILNEDDANKDISIHAVAAKGSSFNIFVADFGSQIKLESHVILFGYESSSLVKVSSMARANELKNYTLSFDHLGKRTVSQLEVYGVCQDDGALYIKGISHIEKNSLKSNASQKVKAILFDEKSVCKASPTLKIDCDDIKASHACAIGALNDEYIFYLESRGLSLNEARKLITLGYLLPIEDDFEGENKEKIDDLIKRRFSDD
jgi:Fe-S cluster assembly protein SufD